MAIASNTWVRAAILATATSGALLADAPRLGLQTLASAPTGSMRSQYTSSTGYGLGAFADWEANFGVNVRLAYDGVFHPGASDGNLLPGMPASVASVSNDRKYRSDTLSLQFLFFPSKQNSGFYYMAGIGAMKQTEKINTTVVLNDHTTLSLTPVQDTGTRLALLAGVGCELDKNWGVFGRYAMANVGGHTIGALQAGVSFRF